MLLFLSMVLVGCSEKENTQPIDEDNLYTEEDIAKYNEPVVLKPEVSTKEAEDPFGNEFFETTTRHVSKVFDEVIKVGDININILKADILSVEGIKLKSRGDYFAKFYRYEDGKPWNLIRVTYTIKNTSDTNLSMPFPIYTIILNTGEQIDLRDMNLLHESGAGDYYANSQTVNLNILIPIKSDPKEVISFKVITDNVQDMNMNILAKKVESEFIF